MHFFKSLKKCPLLCMIMISTVLLTAAAFYNTETDSTWQSFNYKEPLLTKFFLNMSNYTATIKEEENSVLTRDNFTNLQEYNPTIALSGNNTVLSGNAVEENRVYEFQPVTEAYFDDALFIGDSRTDGLHDYAKMGNAVFYAGTSMTIQKVLEAEIATEEGAAETGGEKSRVTVEEALTKNSFGKIYIMLGINELGIGNAEDFYEEYKKVISRIRDLQPQAILFVEGIMRVTSDKSAVDPIYNNDNINSRNALLSTLANQKDIFYIDMNISVTDETGGLNPDYTYDGVHLKASYYRIWKDFLLQNGIIKE